MICAFIITFVHTVFSADTYPGELKTAYERTGRYIESLGIPNVGSVGGEWAVLGLARSETEIQADYYDGYYKNVLEYVTVKINENEQLHRVKSTDNSRVILALTAAGFDAENIGGHNLLKGLSDFDYIKKQGINGPIWALIAFDSSGYAIPEADEGKTQTTRDNLIDEILSRQLDNGGWSMFGSSADPDMTAMALQSLAPYYKNDDRVKASADRAITVLSEIQLPNGGYGSIGGECSESAAQVITALTALKIDPNTDPRFIKNGNSVLDALFSFADENGGFRHTSDGTANGMATEQSYYALVSYFRFTEGKTSLYDMSDLKQNEDNDPNDIEKPGTDTETPSEDTENKGGQTEEPPVSEKEEESRPETSDGSQETVNKPQLTPDNTSDNGINAYIGFLALAASAVIITNLKRKQI